MNTADQWARIAIENAVSYGGLEKSIAVMVQAVRAELLVYLDRHPEPRSGDAA